MELNMQQLGELMDAKRTLCAYNACDRRTRDCSVCQGALIISDAMVDYIDNIDITNIENFESETYHRQMLDRVTAKHILCNHCNNKDCDNCRVKHLTDKTLTQEQLGKILVAKDTLCDYCHKTYECKSCLVATLANDALNEFECNRPSDDGTTTVIHDPEQKAAILKNNALLQTKSQLTPIK